MSGRFDKLAGQVRSCTLCRHELMDGVRPILQVDPRARVLIAGQAPGARAHASGIPFDDRSGDRLRDWMGIERDVFYDPERIAILPMGFCYPGKGKSGDLPPRAICAATWRAKLLRALPNIRLTLLVGHYAQAWHLDQRSVNLTDTVRAWRSCGESVVPLPHPSPRNNVWLTNNPWFVTELLPVLKNRVQNALGR